MLVPLLHQLQLGKHTSRFLFIYHRHILCLVVTQLGLTKQHIAEFQKQNARDHNVEFKRACAVRHIEHVSTHVLYFVTNKNLEHEAISWDRLHDNRLPDPASNHILMIACTHLFSSS